MKLSPGVTSEATRRELKNISTRFLWRKIRRFTHLFSLNDNRLTIVCVPSPRSKLRKIFIKVVSGKYQHVF